MTDGILLLDKPQGLSSSAAVQRVRRALGRIKAGHTGSLDPLATGMLPICLGEGTKVAGFLLDGDKDYRFTARFGARTTTGDLEGEVAERCEVPEDLDAALRAVLPRFTGTISQVPPMYSALKQGGQRLYRLARQGIEVERPAREIGIRQLELETVSGAEATLRVRCSKGTYVRTLAEDLARAVGSCAHLSMLRRLGVQPFESQSMVTLEQVESQPGNLPLLSPDAALLHLGEVVLTAVAAQRLLHGQDVYGTGPQDGALLRLYDGNRRFLGIGRFEAPDRVRPVRIFNHLGAIST